MDCDRITSNLFVGSCLLDGKEVEELRSLGVTSILSLQTEQDMGERGIEWEEKMALATKLAFRSVPVMDFDAADLQRKLPECVMALDRMLQGWPRRLPALVLGVASGAGFGPCPRSPQLLAQRGSHPLRPMADLTA